MPGAGSSVGMAGMIARLIKRLGMILKNDSFPGGHLVVGSIKFVGGMRKDVLAKLAEKIAACGVDEVAEAKGGAAMG